MIRHCEDMSSDLTAGIPSKKYDLEDRTALFAKKVRTFVQKLPRVDSHKDDVPQLMRSSGSVAANYIEANESLGKGDFLMRLRICLKEAKESKLWLSLLNIPVHQVAWEQERIALEDEAHQLVRIFSSILRKFPPKSR